MLPSGGLLRQFPKTTSGHTLSIAFIHWLGHVRKYCFSNRIQRPATTSTLLYRRCHTPFPLVLTLCFVVNTVALFVQPPIHSRYRTRCYSLWFNTFSINCGTATLTPARLSYHAQARPIMSMATRQGKQRKPEETAHTMPLDTLLSAQAQETPSPSNLDRHAHASPIDAPSSAPSQPGEQTDSTLRLSVFGPLVPFGPMHTRELCLSIIAVLPFDSLST